MISINASGKASPGFRACVREHIESAAGAPGFRANRCVNAFIDLSLVLFPASWFFCESVSLVGLKNQFGETDRGESKNRETVPFFCTPGGCGLISDAVFAAANSIPKTEMPNERPNL